MAENCCTTLQQNLMQVNLWWKPLSVIATCLLTLFLVETGGILKVFALTQLLTKGRLGMGKGRASEKVFAGPCEHWFSGRGKDYHSVVRKDEIESMITLSLINSQNSHLRKSWRHSFRYVTNHGVTTARLYLILGRQINSRHYLYGCWA